MNHRVTTRIGSYGKNKFGESKPPHFISQLKLTHGNQQIHKLALLPVVPPGEELRPNQPKNELNLIFLEIKYKPNEMGHGSYSLPPKKNWILECSFSYFCFVMFLKIMFCGILS